MHSKKIFVHIFNYTCILLLCSCTGKKELSFKLLRRFWNWWFLLLFKAHEISSFVLSAINFISHLDSNKYTIKKQGLFRASLSLIWNSANDRVIANESILTLDGKVIESAMKKFHFPSVAKARMIIQKIVIMKLISGRSALGFIAIDRNSLFFFLLKFSCRWGIRTTPDAKSRRFSRRKQNHLPWGIFFGQSQRSHLLTGVASWQLMRIYRENERESPKKETIFEWK